MARGSGGENLHLILIPAMLVQAAGAVIAAVALADYSGTAGVAIGLVGGVFVVFGSLLLVWGASIYCATGDDHPAWAFLGVLNLPGLVVLLAVLGFRRRGPRRGFDVLPGEPGQPGRRDDVEPRPPSPRRGEGGGEGGT